MVLDIRKPQWGPFGGNPYRGNCGVLGERLNKSKFAVCLIFWFELHARWLGARYKEASVGTLWGEIPARGNCGVLGERLKKSKFAF